MRTASGAARDRVRVGHVIVSTASVNAPPGCSVPRAVCRALSVCGASTASSLVAVIASIPLAATLGYFMSKRLD